MISGPILTGSPYAHGLIIEGDLDGDGIPDELDNCPSTSNPGQDDSDGDGTNCSVIGGITLVGGGGNDNLFGGDNILNGGPEDDILNGGAGDDELNGGDGDDVLRGGPGRDTLTGGKGADRFIIGDRDTITDFNPDEGDTIEHE